MPPITFNRHSAPAGELRSSLPIDASKDVQGTQATQAGGSAGAGAVGLPTRLTLPSPPRTDGKAEPAGLDSIEQGLAKTTLAQVNVARRSFWHSALNTAMTAAGLALFTVATGGVGTAAVLGIALTAGYLAKASGDTVMSLMNWRNKKAELEERPPPFGFVNRLPQDVRNDAFATLLMSADVPHKKAKQYSKSLELGLGLGAVLACGYASGGAQGAALSLLPIAFRDWLRGKIEHMEERRQNHVDDTLTQMRQGTADTNRALQEMRDQWLAVTLQYGDALQADPQLKRAQEQLHILETRANALLDGAQAGLIERVERKAFGTTAGAGALAADISTEHGTQVPDMVDETGIPMVMTTAMALRTGIDVLRTRRSEARDNDKLGLFSALHNDLRNQIRKFQDELVARITELEGKLASPESQDASGRETEVEPPAPFPGDPRYA